MAKKKNVAQDKAQEIIEKDECIIAQDAIVSEYEIEQEKVDYSAHPKFNKFIKNKGEKHDK